MKCFVIVREESPGQFTAWPAGIPELKVTAESRERARDGVVSKLFESVKLGELVAVDVPVVDYSNPIPPAIDPADEAELQRIYLEEIQRIRREADELCGILDGDPDLNGEQHRPGVTAAVN